MRVGKGKSVREREREREKEREIQRKRKKLRFMCSPWNSVKLTEIRWVVVMACQIGRGRRIKAGPSENAPDLM